MPLQSQYDGNYYTPESQDPTGFTPFLGTDPRALGLNSWQDAANEINAKFGPSAMGYAAEHGYFAAYFPDTWNAEAGNELGQAIATGQALRDDATGGLVNRLTDPLGVSKLLSIDPIFKGGLNAAEGTLQNLQQGNYVDPLGFQESWTGGEAQPIDWGANPLTTQQGGDTMEAARLGGKIMAGYGLGTALNAGTSTPATSEPTGGLSDYTQLAEGGNTMTDVPLVGDGGATGGALVDGVMVDGATSGWGTVGTSGGTAGGVAGGVAGGTALSRIMDGTATAADYLSLAGNLGSTALGFYGANKQANSLEDLANQYMAMGAPSRARYEGSFAPGFTMANDPGYTDALNQAAKSTLHGMSAKFGNPSDSPNAWNATLKDLYSGTAYPAMQDYRKLNANTGGLSRFAEAAPGVATGAIGAEAGKLNALGYGAANIFNPPSTLEQLMRGMRG